MKDDQTCFRNLATHCVKSVQIRVTSCSYFPEKYGPEITTYLDTFHTVMLTSFFTFIHGRLNDFSIGFFCGELKTSNDIEPEEFYGLSQQVIL